MGQWITMSILTNMDPIYVRSVITPVKEHLYAHLCKNQVALMFICILLEPNTKLKVCAPSVCIIFRHNMAEEEQKLV